jgi:hypothetical protein
MSADAALTLADLHAAVVGVLARVHPHVDLSGSTRVASGVYGAPPELPWASVSLPEVRAEEGRARREIWEHRVSMRIRCWAAVTDDMVERRVTQSLHLGDDLVAALEDATRDVTSILYVADAPRIDVRFDPVSADHPASAAFVELVIEFRYRRLAGT